MVGKQTVTVFQVVFTTGKLKLNRIVSFTHGGEEHYCCGEVLLIYRTKYNAFYGRYSHAYVCHLLHKVKTAFKLTENSES